MTTYVLVPGAWIGGWIWKRVTPLLRAAGHDVYPVSLTGLAERVHLASPAVDLNTHVEDVVNLLHFEDLHDVVLLGHSYAGFVVSGVSERAPERLRRLVYLDAAVPQNGASLFDVNGRLFRSVVEEAVRSEGDGWRWPLPDDETLSTYNNLDDWTEADRNWLREYAVPQPIETFRQPLRRVSEQAAALPRSYVYCSASRFPPAPFVEQARTAPGWEYAELPTGHYPMVTLPHDLARMLLAMA